MSKPDPETIAGGAAPADALRQPTLAQCQERRLRCETGRVEAALQRLEAGDYGYCAVCGEEIGLERLEFDPAAATCIRCAGRGT
jgi:DnaK suppressor protein